MKSLFLLLATILLSFTLHAETFPLDKNRKAVKTTGDILFVAAPLTCLATTFLLKDNTGLKQLILSEATSLGTSYLFKFAVGKSRPDGSNNYSFPSAHASITFTSAAFLQRRYGWKWGIPAYLLSGYVGWSRVYGKKHDWWDVMAGTVIGIGSAYIFTRPFAQKYHLSVSPVTNGKHIGVYTCMKF